MRSVSVSQRKEKQFTVLYYEDGAGCDSHWFADLMNAMSSAHMWMAGFDALSEAEIRKQYAEIESLESAAAPDLKIPEPPTDP